MGKAEKYPLRDGSLHGCRVKYCSMRLFMAALPQRNPARRTVLQLAGFRPDFYGISVIRASRSCKSGYMLLAQVRR